MLYSIVGVLFLIVALIVVVYTIYNSMIKESIKIMNNEANKMNNNKEEE